MLWGIIHCKVFKFVKCIGLAAVSSSNFLLFYIETAHCVARLSVAPTFRNGQQNCFLPAVGLTNCYRCDTTTLSTIAVVVVIWSLMYLKQWFRQWLKPWPDFYVSYPVIFRRIQPIRNKQNQNVDPSNIFNEYFGTKTIKYIKGKC